LAFISTNATISSTFSGLENFVKNYMSCKTAPVSECGQWLLTFSEAQVKKCRLAMVQQTWQAMPRVQGCWVSVHLVEHVRRSSRSSPKSVR